VRTPGRFDVVGAVGLAVGLAGVLVSISRGNELGWGSPAVLASGVGGLVVLGLWGWFELSVRDPLVDLRVASRRAVLFTNLASVATGFSFFCAQITLPQLLEVPAIGGVGFGLGMVSASLALVPLGLAMMVVSPLAGRLSLRAGPRAVLVMGGATMGVSYLLAVAFVDHVWQVVVVNGLLGVGLGLAYAAMPTLIMGAVPASETGAANGLNALMRTLGTSTASAVVAAVLASGLTVHDGVTVPSAGSFQTTFFIGLVGAVVAVALALAIPRPGRVRPPDRPSPARTVVPGPLGS
jgi:MFS family permease